MEWLTKLLSGKDNKTPDIARHSWMWSLLAVFGGAGWNAWHAAVLDLASLSQAVAVVVAAHGGAMWAKAKTEPEADAPPEDTK